MTIAKQIETLRYVKQTWGTNINCDQIIANLTKGKFECPQCKGTGFVEEKYNAYPSGLPDSMWAVDWRYRNVTCDLCKGEGWTDHEYKPRMVQDGWE